MPQYISANVSIHYEQKGSGFPLLLLPPGGLMATIDYWQRTAFNAPEIFSRDFLSIAIDERNAGLSRGPLDMQDPWGCYARDHIGLMNHLGIEKFHVLGSCIGCSHALNLIRLAPERVVSAVLVQPTGIDERSQKILHDSWEVWAGLLGPRPDLDPALVEAFGKKIWSGEFVLSVTRDWVKTCRTPLLVLPGIDAPHPNAIGKEIAALAPNASTLEPWKEPAELIPGVIRQIRKFLLGQTPA